MNKKQKIVVTIVAIVICVILIGYPKKYALQCGYGTRYFDVPVRGSISIIQWGEVLPICIVTLLIGGILIYIFKGK